MIMPRLRFKADDGNDYPDWEEKKFGELYTKNGERNGEKFKADKTISISRMKYNVNGNGADETSLSMYKVLRVGDIAFEGHENKNFAFGRFVLNDLGDGIMSPRFSCLRPITKMLEGFWKYYIHNESVLRHILVCATKKGTMMHELVFDDLYKQKIEVPCLEEQQKIADFLATIDEIIMQSRNEVAAWEKRKKGVMQKIFSQEVRFKADDGRDYPGWEDTKVGYVCSISTGKSNTQDRCDNGEYHFYVRSETVERSKKYLYDEEAVLTAGDGVGTGKIFHYVNGRYDLHQRVYRMYNFKNVLGKYFYYYFSTNFYRRVKSMSAKGSVDSVRMEMIYDMSIKRPCLEEQQKIADCFSSLDEVILQCKAELSKWETFKKGLLQQMFA